jgi:hypothetical protein
LSSIYTFFNYYVAIVVYMFAINLPALHYCIHTKPIY